MPLIWITKCCLLWAESNPTTQDINTADNLGTLIILQFGLHSGRMRGERTRAYAPAPPPAGTKPRSLTAPAPPALARYIHCQFLLLTRGRLILCIRRIRVAVSRLIPALENCSWSTSRSVTSGLYWPFLAFSKQLFYFLSPAQVRWKRVVRFQK